MSEESQKYHLSVRLCYSRKLSALAKSRRSQNPYWLTFDPYVIPLLDGDMQLSRWEEMDVSVPNQDSFEAGKASVQTQGGEEEVVVGEESHDR